MAAEVRFPCSSEAIFISKGVLRGHKTSLSASQMTANTADSRSSSPEGLVIRFRPKQQLRSRRTVSEVGKAASVSAPQYPGPVLRPKKAKMPCRQNSSRRTGGRLGEELPAEKQPKIAQKRGRIGRFPTMLMLRLVNSHSRKSFLESKLSPSLTLVTLEAPSEAFSQLPVRITNLKPVQRPAFRGRNRPVFSEKAPICHFTTLTLDGQLKGACHTLEKGQIDQEKAVSRRKVVFIRRENTTEDLDPDYDQVLSSYYL